MHECPFCGEVCDCDIDDTWGLPVPDDCPHTCYEQEPEDGFDDDDWPDDGENCPFCSWPIELCKCSAPPTPEANDE